MEPLASRTFLASRFLTHDLGLISPRIAGGLLVPRSITQQGRPDAASGGTTLMGGKRYFFAGSFFGASFFGASFTSISWALI